MPEVLLATCRAFPEGEPGGHHLLRALSSRGVAARWASWDDPGTDWAAADLVVVRSTWDYELRREEFLAWARAVEPQALVPSRVLAWNTDKTYLVDLAMTGLPCVPTTVAVHPAALVEAVAEHPTAVVKPVVGAGGRGVVVATAATPDTLAPEVVGEGPWVVQPLVPSVRTEGERSVFVLDGVPGAQVTKVPAAGEIRVHEEYGGLSVPAEPDSAAELLAMRTVSMVEDRLGVDLPIARVDLMRDAAGEWMLGELEVTEPGLYLDVVPANAEPVADLIVRRLRGRDRPET